MGSGARNMHKGSFIGATADVVIETVPFRPSLIQFFGVDPALTPDGFWGYKDDDLMAGDAYISNIAADTGVTIAHDGFTVANGADVNRDGITTYYVCWD